MLTIYLAAGPDRGQAWLIYALLAFLLISIVVGALVGPGVFDDAAPGALHEAQGATASGEEHAGGPA